VLGAPTVRGRAGDTFQEMFDLAGTTRYNPFWGFQNGEKRNAYINRSHQPMALMRYDFNDQETTVTVAAYGQAGVRGETRPDWFKYNNPSPDFNRRLPSAFLNPADGAAWAEQLRQNQGLRQIDWDGIYAANRLNDWTINDADGIPGNTVTGKRSQTVLGDFRSDSRELGINGIFRETVNSRVALHGGLNGQWYVGRNFKTIADLLGGDFLVDYDRFAQQQVPENPLAQINDLSVPNDIVRTGERYGFDYDENIQRGGGWLQVQANLRKWSFFGAGELGIVRMWRTGRMQNGRFPESSIGDSERLTFSTYNAKAGVTYKFNGRNYLYANGLYGTRAPLFRDVFLSPRTRNELVSDAEPYTIRSVEGGYQLRAPYFRARATGYFTQILGEIESFLVFQPTIGVFGTNIMQGIDRQHTGVELAIEAKPIVGWTFTAAANLGQYIYTNRPSLILTLDNTAARILDDVTVYQKDFFVPRTPQTTASASVKYESKQFWFAALTFNFADNLWYQFDPTRRTAGFVETFEPDSELWNVALDQRKAPAAYTLDFFGGKSWRLSGGKAFLYLNAGLNNLLNNRNIVIGGRDAYRNAYANDPTDIRLYTQELTYAPGFNYFVSIAVRH
jgi:TonB dependent receptor